MIKGITLVALVQLHYCIMNSGGTSIKILHLKQELVTFIKMSFSHIC